MATQFTSKETEKRYARGVEAFKARRYEEALQAFAEAFATDSKFYRALVYQGLCHLEMGNAEEARRSLEAAARMAPDYAKAHNGLGNVYRRLGEMDLAIEAFRRAAKMEPRVAEYAYNLGLTHLDLAQVPEAIDAFKAAAACAPADAEIANDLAAAYARHKAYGDAVRVLEEFLARCPDTDRAEEMRVRAKKLKERIESEKGAE